MIVKTNKYHKYKSVELGDQLDVGVLKYMYYFYLCYKCAIERALWRDRDIVTLQLLQCSSACVNQEGLLRIFSTFLGTVIALFV